MTRLYVLDLRQCSAAQWTQCLAALPEERQRRVNACRREDDRVRLTGAGWLLQYALSEFGIPPRDQRFTESPQGKPQLMGRTDLHFSLSHSGHWAVCTLSDDPVGVDVEAPRCTARVAQRFFHPRELAVSDPVSLTRVWTAKEAFLKALGLGLTVPLDSFLVRLDGDNAALEQAYSPLPYRLHQYQLDGDLLCLCSLGEKPEPIFVKPQKRLSHNSQNAQRKIVP